MKDFNVLLGDELRVQRLIKRMTLQEVGDKVGLAKNTISYYEKGKLKLSVDTLISICDAIGISYVDVLEKVISA